MEVVVIGGVVVLVAMRGVAVGLVGVVVAAAAAAVVVVMLRPVLPYFRSQPKDIDFFFQV